MISPRIIDPDFSRLDQFVRSLSTHFFLEIRSEALDAWLAAKESAV